MEFATVLIDAFHAALKDAEETFDRIRRRLAARVFAVAVVDCLMIGKLLADRLVELRLVGAKRRVQNDVFADNGLERLDGQILDLHGNGATAALDHRQHFTLRGRAAPSLPSLTGNEGLIGLADERLVNLDRLAFAAQRLRVTIGHRFADAMRQKPRRAVGAEPKRPHKLMRRDAFLASGHKMEGERPFGHGDMARLHDGADHRGKLLFASPALPKASAVCFSLKFGRFIHDAAMRACGAIRPADRLKMSTGRFFVGEN